jgi:hypothetical protein
VDDSRAKITCSVVGYDKDGNISYMRSVLEMSNAMERATQSRGRAPNAAQHKRQSLRAVWKSRLVPCALFLTEKYRLDLQSSPRKLFIHTGAAMAFAIFIHRSTLF